MSAWRLKEVGIFKPHSQHPLKCGALAAGERAVLAVALSRILNMRMCRQDPEVLRTEPGQ